MTILGNTVSFADETIKCLFKNCSQKCVLKCLVNLSIFRNLLDQSVLCFYLVKDIHLSN